MNTSFIAAVAALLLSVADAQGGAQLYAEELKAHHIESGAPAHPLHEARPSVLRGAPGSAGPFVVSDASDQAFSHFYETSVGSGHMSLTLREDWRTHIRMAAKDLGVKRIRGHGLLDDDMSVSYAYGKHAFYNIDSLVDVLMSVGMVSRRLALPLVPPLVLLLVLQLLLPFLLPLLLPFLLPLLLPLLLLLTRLLQRPIFELSFMPAWLTSGNNSVCHYNGLTDPPKNYSQWGGASCGAGGGWCWWCWCCCGGCCCCCCCGS